MYDSEKITAGSTLFNKILEIINLVPFICL